MTDRPNHRAAAERMLADADEWTAQAGELNPEASELSCLAYGILHALFAIHDTLTAADRYAANEARQRDAGADTLDESDHRVRVDRHGNTWQRAHEGCWMEPGFPPLSHGPAQCLPLRALPFPLTFAPEPPPDAAGDDPSASQDKSGAVGGGGAPTPSTRLSPSCVERWPDCASGEYNPACCRFPKSCSPHGSTGDAQKAILCPECDDHINVHNMEGCRRHRCDCPRTPEDVARALIAQDAPVDIGALPTHRTEVGWRPRCATCDGDGCPDCMDPA